MFGKELIKSLGTPEAKQHMVEMLAPAVLLFKDVDDVWRVVDARKVKTTQFEFKNLEEARKFGKKYRENHNVTNINIRSEEVR